MQPQEVDSTLVCSEAAGGEKPGVKPAAAAEMESEWEEEETTAGVEHTAAARRLCDGFGGWWVSNWNHPSATVPQPDIYTCETTEQAALVCVVFVVVKTSGNQWKPVQSQHE